MSWAIVICNYTCRRCGHSWTHSRFGGATQQGQERKLWMLQDISDRDSQLVLSKVTHYTLRAILSPMCHKCVDLEALSEGDPPQWSPNADRENRPTSRPSLRATRPKPTPTDIKKLLFDD